MVSSFADLVAQAARRSDSHSGEPALRPYDYQERIADQGFPDLLQVPTGSGKTLAAVLPWLWRSLFHPDPSVRLATPRRLVLVLPTRALTDQTEATVLSWLANLRLTEEVRLHVMMGGRLDKRDLRDWRMEMHKHAIVICTLDQLVSRALLRGYGVPRTSYSVDFALVTNGAQIVVDEIQLVPQGTTTLRQLSAFQQRFGTAEPCGLTVMSATVDERILDTIDNPFHADTASVVRLTDADRVGSLARRLDATRTIRRLPENPTTLAAAILERHVPHSLTLVVVNTVDQAVATYSGLVKLSPGVETVLVHSQFRGVDRARQMQRLARLTDPSGPGGIVVATQAIEAGVDIDARTLVTEAAPWSSVVQRAGRCNRAGLLPDGDAIMWWTAPAQPKPYAALDVHAAVEGLTKLEDVAVTFQGIHDAGAALPVPDLVLRTLRRRDFEQLFDTTPDLSGSDVDIQPYIRAELDLDVQVAWVPDGWVAVDDKDRGRAALPPEPLRCSVGIPAANRLLDRDGVEAWLFVPSADAWLPAKNQRLKPQDVVLVTATSGGYLAETGFSPASRAEVPIPDIPHTPPVPEGVNAADEAGAMSLATGWRSLGQHLDETRQHARALMGTLDAPGIGADLRRVVAAAAYLHDVGKAHPDWQRALTAANPTPSPDGGTLWAKSPGTQPLRVIRETPERGIARREGFRHELVSVFMISTPAAAALLDQLDVPPSWHPLVRYLVAAHHGHLRVSARDPRWDGRDGRGIFGCFHDEPTPPLHLDGTDLPSARMNLGIFETGQPDSWSDHVMKALAALGPFRLAYLETLVRMADWRASANLEPARVSR